MDYKEKYEQALKKAKAYDNVREKIVIRFGSNVAEEIFFEYEENEDEKIRKGLIDFLKSPFVNENITDEKVTPWIAWLEKQGGCSIKWNKNTKDNKPQVNHSVLMQTTHGIAEGEWQGEQWHQYRWASIVRDTDVLSWIELSSLEKQGEQKPMPREYADAFDEFISHIPEKEPEFSESCYNYDDMVAAVQFGINYQKSQKPAELSEEDVEMIDLLISILEINHPDTYFKSTDKGDANMKAVPTKKIINWLKSLKERVQTQPKQEWCEEDEQRRRSAIEHLENSISDTPSSLRPYIRKDIEWLKSLKERMKGE